MRTFFKLLLISACFGAFYISFTFKKERREKQLQSTINNSLLITSKQQKSKYDSRSLQDTLVIEIKEGKNTDVSLTNEDAVSLGKILANQFKQDTFNKKVIVIQTLKRK